jgi:hypothetical protein
VWAEFMWLRMEDNKRKDSVLSSCQLLKNDCPMELVCAITLYLKLNLVLPVHVQSSSALILMQQVPSILHRLCVCIDVITLLHSSKMMCLML